MTESLTGKRVLVTGATGFIGGRLVERLCLEEGAQVQALVRNFTRAANISRFPVKMLKGDVTEAESVLEAAKGCDVIFHLAYGTGGNQQAQRRVNVEGTDNVVQATLREGVSRVVHVSTVSVYGNPAESELEETCPRRYTGEVYGDSKLDAEKLALDYAQEQGLPVSVVQPTVVYGPDAPVWTITPLRQLTSGRVILIDGGAGLCNAVYIDDVVTALILAATVESAIGQAFLISGPEPVTWRDFLGAYEHMLGVNTTVDMSMNEALAYYRRLERQRRLMSTLQSPPVIASAQLARWILPDSMWHIVKERKQHLLNNDSGYGVDEQRSQSRPVHPLSPESIRFFAAKTRVCIDKAEQMIGYRPSFDLRQGMALTGAWARWANLIR